MQEQIQSGTPADLARIAAFLDGEFVFKKGRDISLARRFPDVFAPANAHNLFFIERNSAIVSALVTRPFEWRVQGKSWRGAMIGAVHTDDAFKGMGMATRVLGHAQSALRDAGVDFTVLWTVQHDFYRKLGWRDLDCGVFGEARGEAVAASAALPVTDEQVAEVQAIRSRWNRDGLRREDADYRRLPLPAESVRIVLHGDGDERAYALVGHVGTSGVMYEMIGHPAAFARIWREIQASFKKIGINECEGSASHRWLQQHADIAWQRKSLAMWSFLNEKIDFATNRDWYVGYFDRI